MGAWESQPSPTGQGPLSQVRTAFLSRLTSDHSRWVSSERSTAVDATVFFSLHLFRCNPWAGQHSRYPPHHRKPRRSQAASGDAGWCWYDRNPLQAWKGSGFRPHTLFVEIGILWNPKRMRWFLSSILVLQSKRQTMMFYPTDPNTMYGMFALRLGKYKAHFYTRGTVGFRCMRSIIETKHLALILHLFLFLHIRCYPQWYHPRPRLPSICSSQGPWPPFDVRPGSWPLRALPALPGGKTRPPSLGAADQESQGAVWRLHGVWWEPGIKGIRLQPGALLQSTV